MNKTIKDVEWKSQQIWHSLIVMKANSWDEWDNDTKTIYNDCRRLLNLVQKAIKNRDPHSHIQKLMNHYNSAVRILLDRLEK